MLQGVQRLALNLKSNTKPFEVMQHQPRKSTDYSSLGAKGPKVVIISIVRLLLYDIR